MRRSAGSFATLAAWLRRRRAARASARRAEGEALWRRDPLSHPTLRRMRAHDLADLPLDRSLFR